MTHSYHNHTWRCKHAQGTEEEYCRLAIEAGVRVFGFSDHAPLPDSFVLSRPGVHKVRMEFRQLGEYVSTVRDLKKKYEGKLNVLLGLETEYIPSLHRELMELYRPYGLDYQILGQHFLREGAYFTLNPTDSDELLTEYVDTVLAATATGDFAMVAHPDLINYVGSTQRYEKEMRRLLEGLKPMGLPIEINLHGILGGRNYPNERFWKIAGEIGNPTILGCDAHCPEEVHDPDNIAKGMELALRCGVKLIDGIF